MVLSSYRKDDFADPDNYAVQLAMVLERYPDKVIDAVTSPVTGIQRTCKFPPAIAEMVEFIDEYIRRTTFVVNYDARSCAQIVEREEYERQGKAETPEYRKGVAGRIMQELRGYGFQFEGDVIPQQRTWTQFFTEELLAKYWKST